MTTVLRVSLTGRDAELGKVAAADFARLLIGVERVVARAAGHVIGRQVKPTGRRGRTIEDAAHFRLLAVETGSVVGVLELADAPEEAETLDLEAAGLGELALDAALATITAPEQAQLDVAEAFVRLADDIGLGSRFAAVVFDATRESPRRAQHVVFDQPARERLAGAVDTRTEPRDDSLVGVLFEADFESETALLRSGGGQRIAVRFGPELADQVQEALRHQAQFGGEVAYDPKTMSARSVKLNKILWGTQLTLGLDPGDFWSVRPLHELAAEQGIGPVDDIAALRDEDASPEEIDRLMAALGGA
jgi:hypothetical protein